MLESGYTVFDCQVVKLVSENAVYQSYLVSCPDSTIAKLLLLLPDPLFDQKQRQSFIDHTSWLASQTFPDIGSPLRAGEIEGQSACLYHQPPGEPLEQILNEPFSVRRSVDLIKKIALCLSVPHSAGLWHGNLSPDTIYLDGDSPFLADFSLSQLIRLDYNSGINPQYTSPEQVRGETPGVAADLYNLGCIFYHLLTGEPPHSGDDAFSIAKQHLQGDFPSLPEELKLLQPVLDSMTETVAEERIIIDKLVAQLEQLSADQELDQLKPAAPVTDSLPDNSPSGEGASLLDGAMTSSEMAARIEARLKKHAGDLQETAPVEIPIAEESDVAAELSQISRKEKNGIWRFVLVLILGVVIGSGSYFLFFKQSPAMLPVVVDADIKTNDILAADLDQGLRLWQEADFNGAESVFKKIITEYQKDPRAYNNLAAFYAAQGNYDQARDFLELALAIDENYATVYRNLGAIYAEMARGSYGRALQLDKSQALISLPVFSSQGVVNLNPMAEIAVVVLEESSERDQPSSQLSQPGQQIAAIEVATVDSMSDLSPTVVAQIKNEDILPVEKEEQFVVAAEQDQPSELKQVNSVTAVLEPEDEESFLQRWGQAWSDQDVDEYLTFYGETFIPPAGKSRVAWEAQRRTRILAPKKITVSLDSFQLILQDNNHVQIEVIQSYKSEMLVDKTRKIFNLKVSENSWKIIRERSLGVVR